MIASPEIVGEGSAPRFSMNDERRVVRSRISSGASSGNPAIGRTAAQLSGIGAEVERLESRVRDIENRIRRMLAGENSKIEDSATRLHPRPVRRLTRHPLGGRRSAIQEHRAGARCGARTRRAAQHRLDDAPVSVRSPMNTGPCCARISAGMHS